MAESVMRQGMETWLKKECRDTGNDFMDVLLHINYGFDAATDIRKPDYDSARFQFNIVKERFDDMVKNGHITTLEADGLKDAISDAEGKFETEEQEDYLWSLYDKVVNVMFEKVVECQCGKPGEEKHPPVIVHSISFPETNEEWQSLVVAIKTARRKEVGEYDQAFDSLVDEKFESIRFSLPEADDTKRWLVSKASELGIKEY